MALDFYCHDRSLRHIGKVLGACFVLASLGLLLVEQDIDVFNYIYFVCVCVQEEKAYMSQSINVKVKGQILYFYHIGPRE